MIERDTSKKRLFYVVVLILTFVVMVIGVVMAYSSFVASQNEESTVIYTGTLQINYIDGVYLKNPTLFPLSSVGYDTYDAVYRNSFIITSTGTLDQTIDVDMVLSKNEFSTNELKYALYNSVGKRLATGLLNGTGTINLVNSVYLPHNSETTYTLIIWWADGDKEIMTPAGSVVSGKINVNAKQVRY